MMMRTRQEEKSEEREDDLPWTTVPLRNKCGKKKSSNGGNKKKKKTAAVVRGGGVDAMKDDNEIEEYNERQLEEFRIETQEIRRVLQDSFWYETCKTCIMTQLNRGTPLSHSEDFDEAGGDCSKVKLIALGIGRFMISKTAQWQWSLLLLLKDLLPKDRSLIMCYDPMFTVYEVKECQLAGIEVSTTNDQGLWPEDKDPNTAAEAVTLFYYMPHCPYQLYCNVLWSNWAQLNRILILGNSFSSYGLRRAMMPIEPENELKSADLVKQLSSVEDFMKETSLRIDRNKDKEVRQFIEAAFCDLR